MDATAIVNLLKQDWLPAACVAGWLALKFSDGMSLDGLKAKLSGVVSAVKAKLHLGTAKTVVELTPPQRAHKLRCAALLSLRHLSAELPPDERTDALAVLDQADLLCARVGERAGGLA